MLNIYILFLKNKKFYNNFKNLNFNNSQFDRKKKI